MGFRISSYKHNKVEKYKNILVFIDFINKFACELTNVNIDKLINVDKCYYMKQ